LHALIGNREAEIERLRADYQRICRGHDQLHNERDDARAEIERLRADKDVIRSQERNATYERDIAALAAEIERLRAVLMSYASLIEQQEAEIKRLRAALKGAFNKLRMGVVKCNGESHGRPNVSVIVSWVTMNGGSGGRGTR
jgi:chromosome segregation ATPase